MVTMAINVILAVKRGEIKSVVMAFENLAKQTHEQAYKVGQLKALLKMVYETVDEKHINPSLRNRIKSEIL